MTRTISITLPERLFSRIEELRRERGGLERSKLVQEALSYYLRSNGPDPKVVQRWKKDFESIGDLEARSAERWRQVQAKALGRK